MDSAPSQRLSVIDGITICIGVVIGAGIFKTPSIVAATLGNAGSIMILWAFGGLVTLIGALTYAELASAYPDAGGDYFYLKRAYGDSTAFLFVWARMTVIQTGSIAMWAFLIGDYATAVFPLGGYSSSIYAAIVIIILTLLNIAGIRPGIRFQKVLIAAIITGIAVIAVIAIIGAKTAGAPAAANKLSFPTPSAIGSAMIFILLTYGGWNEAVYLSGEVKNPERSMTKVLMYSVFIITVVYCGLNYIFLKGLGIAKMAESETVAVDLMREFIGDTGALFIGILITVAALSSMNGVIITSARTTYALGRDTSFCSFLGQWDEKRGTPVNSLLFLCTVSLFLVAFGTGSIKGFTMMVEYTAPVFWLFFLLTGISYFILRKKDAAVARPFKTPLYPVLPLMFCGVCVYMLRASTVYTGKGALLGVAVLTAGIPLLFLENLRKNRHNNTKNSQ